MNTLDVSPASIDSDRLSHAYIAGSGLADIIATAAVCSGHVAAKPCMACVSCGKAARRIHPDVIVVDKQPDKREIVVDQIRRLKKDVIVLPTESEKKAYIINNADSMNMNAQNAFLQMLEDPPGYAVFILSTDTPEALLRTVRSRCVELRGRHEFEAAGSVALEMADELFSAIDGGSAPLAGLMFRLEKLDKETFGAFIDAAREQAAKRLRTASPAAGRISRKTIADTERTLCRAKEMLDLNVNVMHISGLICASLIDKK